MPLSAAAGAAIAGAASAIGGTSQALLTGKMNRKTRSWNEKMMHRQREWALADWEMQNQYNSPTAQMQRLKEAGLNPNLVYGGGSATQQAGVVKNTDAPGWNPETPNVGQIAQAPGMALGAYYNIQQQKAQTDLIKQQTLLAEENVKMNSIRQASETLGIIMKNFKYQQDQKLAPYNLQFLKEKISQTQQGVIESLARMSQMSWSQNLGQQRLEMDKTRQESDLSTANLQRMIMRMSMNKTTEEIAQIKQNVENAKKQGTWQGMMNDLQAELQRLGLTTSDPAAYKIIMKFADKLGKP